MRMSRRAGLISGGDPNSCRVTISYDTSSPSSDYPGNYIYVSIEGTDYKCTASAPGPWQLTVPKNTAAIAYLATSPQDFAQNAGITVNYLGQNVLTLQSSSKRTSDSYDFVIDRNLSIVYRMNNEVNGGKSYLYIREA